MSSPDKRESLVREAAGYIREHVSDSPLGGIILGTGLSSLTDNVENGIVIPYKDIPGFPVSTAPSHRGQLMIGEYGGKRMLIMQGRFHYYEGYSPEQITFPIRVMQELGLKFLFVTNAAGSLNRELQPGDLVLLEDHINFMGFNPLIGKQNDRFGERFPSMNEPYSLKLSKLIRNVAEEEKIELKNGVYLAVSGPSLETRSECRAFAAWGADLVGMSTVPEVIVAVQAKIEVLAISVVTNMSNLFHKEVHIQTDIESFAQKAYDELSILLQNTIERI